MHLFLLLPAKVVMSTVQLKDKISSKETNNENEREHLGIKFKLLQI